MSYTEQLLGTIDARIAEANEQIGSLEGALEALRTDGESAAVAVAVPAAAVRAAKAVAVAAPVAVAVSKPAAVAVSKPAGAAKRAAGATKRATARPRKVTKLDAEGLMALLEAEAEGLSAAAIAERANASYNQVLELLRDREQAGDVRRTGSRRTTVWRVITDEERIAARAAELAARA